MQTPRAPLPSGSILQKPRQGIEIVKDDQSSRGPAFTEHELRSRALAEVHARPSVPIEGAKRILHFAFTTDQAAAVKAREALEAFCRNRACPVPASEARQHRIELPPAVLRWEHHGEFMTYSWEFSQKAPDAALADLRQLAFQPGSSELASFMRLLPQPGPLLVAADLHLLPEGQTNESWRALFEPSRLAASEVMGGAAIAATDFHPDASGFVRMLVLDRHLTAREAGSLVRWLLEVDTYRTLALLGLPEAEAVGHVIRQIEAELPRLVQQMRQGEGIEASRKLLDRLTALAAELEAGAAHTLYRFGATRAYHELVRHRLDAIGEEPLPHLPTLAAFLTRRLMPAIRTCASTEERQENLSQKLARAAQLLRTRVEIELESQNKDLLSGMSDRFKLQLKLQQAVKGVSIVAITYYLLTILRLIYEGVERKIEAFDPALATAVSVPFVFGLVFFLFRRRAKKLDRADK
jgi:uncharacterized membrane-anchored protein